jgi:hypothetical protein
MMLCGPTNSEDEKRVCHRNVWQEVLENLSVSNNRPTVYSAADGSRNSSVFHVCQLVYFLAPNICQYFVHGVGRSRLS